MFLIIFVLDKINFLLLIIYFFTNNSNSINTVEIFLLFNKLDYIVMVFLHNFVLFLKSLININNSLAYLKNPLFLLILLHLN